MKKLLLIILLTSAPAYAEQVDKETWIAYMQFSLPEQFCQEDFYFRQCFNVTEQQCKRSTLKAFNSCLDMRAHMIPDILNLPEDGEKWGSSLGACAGEIYDRKHVPFTSEKCRNLDYWK